jgi:hypothetical protein
MIVAPVLADGFVVSSPTSARDIVLPGERAVYLPTAMPAGPRYPGRRAHLGLAGAAALALVARAAAAAGAPLPPPDEEEQLARVGAVGSHIFTRLIMTSVAEAAVLKKYPDERNAPIDAEVPLGGAPSHHWRVAFVAGANTATPKVRFEVAVETVPDGKSPSVRKIDPPAAPEPELAALLRARTSALRAIEGKPSDFRTLVMRRGSAYPPEVWRSEDREILVYVFESGEKRWDELVLKQHHRAIVSPDGGKVTSIRAFAARTLSRSAETNKKGQPMRIIARGGDSGELLAQATFSARSPRALARAVERGLWKRFGTALSQPRSARGQTPLAKGRAE